MSQTVHIRIKALLEGTYEAFESSGSMNADYASFAAMAVQDFKSALEKPSLTARELRLMIREAHRSHTSQNTGGCWASFMADHVARSSNTNTFEGL